MSNTNIAVDIALDVFPRQFSFVDARDNHVNDFAGWISFCFQPSSTAQLHPEVAQSA